MSRGFRHVVLDWDGTLVDTLGTKAAHAAEILGPALDAKGDAVVASYYRHSGVPRRKLFDAIASELRGSPLTRSEYSRLSEEFTTRNLAGLAESPLQPGAATTLRTLAERGVRMAVSSAAPGDELRPRVAHSGLAPLFDQVLATRRGFSKGPEHIRHLAGRWETPTHRILVVGDEAADAALARLAHAKSALVLHTLRRAQAKAARPDHILERLDRLLALCAENR